MDSRPYWMAQALRLASRRNVARWLDFFLPAALFISAAAASAVLALRQARETLSPAWIGWAVLLALAAGAAGWRLRRHWYRREDALVVLEYAGGLHSSLSTAAAGIGAWPTPRPVADDTRWHWPRLAGFVLASALLLALAQWVPLPEERAAAAHPAGEPMAWTELQDWLNKMKEAEVVEPPALEEAAKQLQALREQAPEKWFAQSSLEASDSLRERTENALRDLQQDLQEGAEAAESLMEPGQNQSSEQLAKQSDALQQAIRGLESGAFPLNQQTLQGMKKLQAGGLKAMSQQEWEKLRERMQQGRKIAQECVNPRAVPNDMGGRPKPKPGPGGPGGGGETAPLTLGDDATDLKTKQMEGLTNEDLSRALPGDLAGLSQGEHQVDNTAKGLASGGAVASPGTGGSAVWHQTLVPRERTVLQKFFK